MSDRITAEPAVNFGRDYVEQMLRVHEHFNPDGDKDIIGNPAPVYEFLLQNGQEWKGTPWTKFRGRGYRKMTPRHCFGNAWQMSLVFDNLTYYEGFAWSGLITVHHAWCVDDQGLVVDPTWRKKNYKIPENEWHYFGVGWDSHALMPWMAQKMSWSVLFDMNYNEGVEEFVVTA